MSEAAARIVMALAERTLSRDRAGWAAAMHAEFDEAAANGAGLSFASGCLRAAWQDLPFHSDGRLRLAAYALALGVIVPLAILTISCSLPGISFMMRGYDHYYTTLASGTLQQRALASAYKSAVPITTAFIVLLGLLHLFIAWAVLQRSFRRLVVLWPAAGLVALALVGFAVRLFPSAAGAAITVFLALAVELMIVPALIWWNRRVSKSAS